MIEKSQLRQLVLGYRRMLSEEEFVKRNTLICDSVLKWIDTRKCRVIHLFTPIARNREVDLTVLFPALWKRGMTIVTSKTDFKRKKMTHHEIGPTTRLVENKYGIPEPEGTKEIPIDSVDVVIVPMVLGDKKGNRIGYGGGYYDRLLNEFDGPAVGVSLSSIADDIPSESHDVSLSEILSPIN